MLELLRTNRNFRLLWSAQIVSELGDWFYSIAIFSFLLELTGSAKMVSLAFMMQVLPQTLASPAAGVINDRIRRRSVMLFADWSRAVIVFSMIFVTSRDTLWVLFILLFLETLMWALFEPARNAVIPNITSPEERGRANALSATTWSVNFALGTAIGGLVAAFAGRQAVFVLNALSFILSAILIRGMKFDEPHAEGAKPLHIRDLIDYSPIIEGIRYVRRDRRLLATMMVKGGLGIMGSNWVILPIYGERLFPVQFGGLTQAQGATLGMSLLLGARGVGSIVGAFGSVGGGSKTEAGHLRRMILWGFAGGALGYLLLGAAPSILFAVAALIIAHTGSAAVWTASSTLLQEQTDDRFRGRVFSAEFALMMFWISVSSVLAGFAVDWGVSARTAAYATGFAVLIPLALWLLAQRLWRTAANVR